MKSFTLIFLIALLPLPAYAANGARCAITPPSTANTAETINNVAGSCVDICDYAGSPAINGVLTCGPIWMPLQNAASTTFAIMADESDCLFDTVDIVRTLSATDPANDWQVVLGTLDDDGTGGSCGASPCIGLDVPYPIAGYIWVTSNAATVGGAGCTSFKLRMTQGAQK